ncbi:MAG TPA: CAP domain-containing protein [Polyangiaceae bacterium]|nr:CAP domain-containing protein [Polyangiaceae bacterium]
MARPVTWLFAALAGLAACGVLVDCAATPPPFSPAASREQGAAVKASSSTDRRGSVESAFVETIGSPQPALEQRADARALSSLCATSDAALVRVATRLAARSGGVDGVDPDTLDYELRRAGAPYVWPRAWRFDGDEAQLDDARARMQRWLSGFGDGGSRRCGVAVLHKADTQLTVAAVAVDVLADLDALPTRVRIGQWVDVRATLHVPADAAKLIVLGPRGAPHAVPTTLDNGRLQARFNADHEGAWLVQVLAAVDGGPRPLLEALLFAGVEPPTELVAPQAPGEEAAQAVKDPRAALYGMVNAARATEQAAPLERDARLEELAQAHAEAMRHARKTAHDVGDGDLNQRLANAGLELRAGENVAHAANAALSHRALWASPSHRENLLFPNFDVVGIGVAPDADGTLWICELFASTH